MLAYTHISKTAKIGTVNLVAEHFGVVTMCSKTKFTVPIFGKNDRRLSSTEIVRKIGNMATANTMVKSVCPKNKWLISNF